MTNLPVRWGEWEILRNGGILVMGEAGDFEMGGLITFYGLWKANRDKCHFICSTNDQVNLIVENQIIDNSKREKLLGVKFDYKLTCNAYFDDISKKAGLKLNVLSRIALGHGLQLFGSLHPAGRRLMPNYLRTQISGKRLELTLSSQEQFLKTIR